MAVQLLAVLWAAQRNSDYADPFIVGQLSLLQMSLREVASRLSSSTNCLMCSYFQMLRSSEGGFYMMRSILLESSPE